MREILIDWFQFTIKFSDDYLRELKIVNCTDINAFLCKHIFKVLFNIDSSLITNEFSKADVEIYDCRGLCSFYAEKGGLIIGYEGC